MKRYIEVNFREKEPPTKWEGIWMLEGVKIPYYSGRIGVVSTALENPEKEIIWLEPYDLPTEEEIHELANKFL